MIIEDDFNSASLLLISSSLVSTTTTTLQLMLLLTNVYMYADDDDNEVHVVARVPETEREGGGGYKLDKQCISKRIFVGVCFVSSILLTF